MSYPQPSSDDVAKSAIESIFRLNTQLVSAGDIYESSQSAEAFALGPESDISKVVIAYLDDEAPNRINQFTLSPRGAWYGRINARLDASFPPSARPGRILIWPAEIYSPDYRPSGFDPEADTVEFFAPRLDVIQYLKPPGVITTGRADRQYLFERLPIPLGSLNVVLPFYGRRYASILATNQTVDALSGSILGVNFGIGDVAGAGSRDQETVLYSLAISAGVTRKQIIRASVDGMFDALVLQASFPAASTGPLVIQITFSDTEV